MQDIMEFVRNHPILCVAWVALLVLVVGATAKSLFSRVKTISRGEATILINKEKATVVDVRNRDEFKKGHISGAINVQAEELKKGNFNALESVREKCLILTCAAGNQAYDLAEKLSSAGFAQVYVLKDGINGWNSDNLPLVRTK
jgi:rhodanese-related sulfurtransferase